MIIARDVVAEQRRRLVQVDDDHVEIAIVIEIAKRYAAAGMDFGHGRAREIEEFLAHHPKILRVAVIGLPHSRTGEQCVACIVPKPGETVTKEEVARFLEGKVAVFKLPERVEIMSELPMSAMGKVLKRVLQANLKEP